MLQADFFGLPGLADKASAGLEADPTHRQGEAGGPNHAAPAGCQYDSVYLETGFHPVKSEFNVLQQQQAATMEVTLSSLCMLPSPSEMYQSLQGCSCPTLMLFCTLGSPYTAYHVRAGLEHKLTVTKYCCCLMQAVSAAFHGWGDLGRKNALVIMCKQVCVYKTHC